eukprot:1153687-Pelagomonas_calceolata.AAC.1
MIEGSGRAKGAGLACMPACACSRTAANQGKAAIAHACTRLQNVQFLNQHQQLRHAAQQHHAVMSQPRTSTRISTCAISINNHSAVTRCSIVMRTVQ